jgi:DNA-binding transcriptional LysR family regulator
MNRASLVDLQAFATVARCRSFRQAAVELGVSPSALSHALRGLEARLGVRLLNRTTRSVAPTAAGEQLLKRLTPALDALTLALEEVNDFRDSPSGSLRINSPRVAAELILGSLVNRFLHRYPGMRVELVCDDAFVDIVKTGFDAGVRFGESLQKDMIALPLGPEVRFVVVASPEFLARHGRPDHPRYLQALPCIRMRFPSGAYYRWEFQREHEKIEVDVDGPLALDDLKLITEAATAGLGFAYVYAHHAAAGLASGHLVSVLDDWCPHGPGFQFYYPSRELMPAGLKAFVEFLKEERLAWRPTP